MRPPNYQQNRKQREQSRKERQAEKLQRRTARVRPEGEADPNAPAPADGTTPTTPGGQSSSG